MPALRELQAAIGTAMLGGDAGAAALEIEADGLAPEARLEIYRHHILTTLTSALEATFPVVCRLVDRRFFAYAADTYLRAHPPTGPCLFEYGDSFPDFLAAFPPCRDLAYLPDVARLEWAMSAALHAPDVDAMDPARLAHVGAEDMPRLTFVVDPSVSFLASPWPIDRIWHANQDGVPSDPVDLASGGVRLEVRRAGDVATVRSLAAADYALRTGLARGGPLEDASAAALGIDPHFDLTAALHALLGERIFTGFAVSNSQRRAIIMMTNTMSSTATATHPTPGILARLAAIGARLGRFPLAIHQLLFRFAIAGVFLRAGLDKVRSWETTVALFRDEYKVPVLPPEFAAAMASTVEIGCSMLLILGLASRLATLPMLGMLLTIQLFVYPQAWPEHLVWGSILLFLLTRGAGAVSLDQLLGLERAE